MLICGDPVLKRKAAPADPTDPELKTIVKDMFDTMYENRGVGLAAPQIGLSISLFVINHDWNRDEGKEKDGVEEVFINPKLLKAYGKDEGYEEGCLSVPEIHEKVQRKDTIDIEYTDLKGKKHTETGVTGLRARVFQHEYDHLHGILFIDRLSPVKKMFVKKELKRIIEEME
ncbi:MAG: peptide deformylase [Fibrobacteres bacterium]|nr:peptide deformylase [Fibrobacterota bacterium]